MTCVGREGSVGTPVEAVLSNESQRFLGVDEGSVGGGERRGG